jgi:prevent-host-death family protein
MIASGDVAGGPALERTGTMVIEVVMMKTVSATDFKATCLRVLDTVAETRQGIVVTKRGKPVARVVPMINRPDNIVGAMRGTIEIRGDIVGPVGVKWKALKG